MSGRKQLPNQRKSPVRSRQAAQQSINTLALTEADRALEDLIEINIDDIAALDVRVTQNESDIASLVAADVTIDTRLDALEAEDIVLDGRLDTAEADIAALEAADVVLTASIATNASNISTNTTNIATNASDIAALEAFDATLGTAAFEDIGTSGANVPLLNGANTWSGVNTYSTGIVASTDSTLPTGKVKLGRSTAQYMDFFGSAAGHSVTAVSPAANPKHRIFLGVSVDDGASHEATFRFDGSDSSLYESVRGYTFWSSGNDGSGSGLDADLLDGAHVGTSGAAVPLLNGTNTWSGAQTLLSTLDVTGASTLTGGFSASAISSISTTSSLPLTFTRTGSSAGLGHRYTNTAGYVEWFGIPTGTNAGSFVPGADNSIDLGSSTYSFKNGYFDGVVYHGAGASSAPVLAYITQPQTGMYFSGTNAVDFTVAGTRMLTVGSSGLSVRSGTSTGTASIELAPGRTGDGYSYIDFVGDATYTDYGLRIIRNNTGPNTSSQILHRGTGNLALVAQDAAGIVFSTSGATRVGIQSTGEIYFNHQAQTTAGSAAIPSLSFAADTNTGWYRVGADNIGISTGGTLRFDISTTAVTSTLPIVIPLGSATAPGLALTGDLNTGIWTDTADTLKFTTGGTSRLSITSSGNMHSSYGAYLGNGTAAAVTYGFNSDNGTGHYRIGASNLGLSLGGTKYVDYSTSLAAFTMPVQAAIAISSETTGALTSASRNKTVQCSGNITLPASGMTDGDVILIDPRGTARTITRPAAHTMYINDTDSATGTTKAHNIVTAMYHGSSKWTIQGAVT